MQVHSHGGNIAKSTDSGRRRLSRSQSAFKRDQRLAITCPTTGGIKAATIFDQERLVIIAGDGIGASQTRCAITAAFTADIFARARSVIDLGFRIVITCSWQRAAILAATGSEFVTGIVTRALPVDGRNQRNVLDCRMEFQIHRTTGNSMAVAHNGADLWSWTIRATAFRGVTIVDGSAWPTAPVGMIGTEIVSQFMGDDIQIPAVIV
jgi:hypothetical protein